MPLLDLAGEFEEKYMSDRVRVDIENHVATVMIEYEAQSGN